MNQQMNIAFLDLMALITLSLKIIIDSIITNIKRI